LRIVLVVEGLGSLSVWYLDSGCFRQMTGDQANFAKLSLKNEWFVTYGDNNKGKSLEQGS